MAEENKLVKVIKSYDDLKNSKPGELILIKGRTELIIGSDSEYLKTNNFYQDKIYTFSVEGEYLVQNQYDKYKYQKFGESGLEPSEKTSCKKGAGVPLEAELLRVAALGGIFL